MAADLTLNAPVVRPVWMVSVKTPAESHTVLVAVKLNVKGSVIDLSVNVQLGGQGILTLSASNMSAMSMMTVH